VGVKWNKLDGVVVLWWDVLNCVLIMQLAQWNGGYCAVSCWK